MTYATYARLNVHVHASPLTVARALWSRLKRPLATGPEARARRRSLLVGMLCEHRDARSLYHEAMG